MQLGKYTIRMDNDGLYQIHWADNGQRYYTTVDIVSLLDTVIEEKLHPTSAYSKLLDLASNHPDEFNHLLIACQADTQMPRPAPQPNVKTLFDSPCSPDINHKNRGC